ncbi:hypothetical protein ES288_1Z005100v1 [Gossypium darwinii]|uniref:Eukaryotic translation initiation factor 3 subunit D n=1 Tax=Gossypium darwinii TaxID=34276 RepID=A0A5C7J0D0_GOSDA|nr:hypothetical protein ES288_1Z005100v1 [Gossypium darwinii]
MVGVFEVGAVPFNPDGWGPPDSAAAASTTTTPSPCSLRSFLPLRQARPNRRLHPLFPSSNANPSNRPSSRHGAGNPADSPFDFSHDVDAFPLANPKTIPHSKERARRDRLYNLNRSNQNQQRREAAIFKSSVDIQPEWNMLDQIPFSTFSKLSFPFRTRRFTHLRGVRVLRPVLDRITPKNERRLERFKNRNFLKSPPPTTQIRRLANEDKATVFATDTILSTLMCAPRSVYSWDIVIQRVGNKLFFDKRWQVLVRDGNKVSFDEPNPYRRWKLDNDMHLVARCEVQSVVDVNNQKSFLTLNALNEFDPKYSGVDWRQNYELKNNANKLAKWTAQAILANADLMKLGYGFAAQINLNTANMWGIVKSVVDLCMKLNEGKYVLVKDPSKPQVRIYEVPADAFENDYVEEPLPEEEQVQPPTEDAEDGEANGTTKIT